nr:uncharacterized protein LOC111417866 isoform X1 [Onthophagus taurus]
MSSGFKPILSQVSQQGPPTYGQPSTHVAQNLASMQHGLPTPAHNSSSQNHYLNVPKTEYNAAMSIPASNHPIPNVTQSSPAYISPVKQDQFPTNYQQGHPVVHPPQPTLPTPHAIVPKQESPEKPHSNGTSEMQGSQSGEQNYSPQKPKEIMEKSSKDIKPATPVSNLTDESSNEIKQDENVPDVIDSSSSASIEGIEITTSNSSMAEIKPEEAEVPSESANVTEVIAKATIEPATTIDSAQGGTVTTDNSVGTAIKEQVAPKLNVKPPTRAAQSKKTKAVAAEATAEVSTTKSISKPDKPLVTKMPRAKRVRKKVQPYQYPIPELENFSKMANPTKSRKRDNDENLIIFYKNEFLAVRNVEGGFFVCQVMQNVYKRSTKISIRWLSQDSDDKSGEIYIPDFYDTIDVDCILTNLELSRVNKVKFRLPPTEKNRTDSILKRALAVEKGEAVPPSPTEEHPDGLDLSLYKEESQLQKPEGKPAVRKHPARSPSRTRQKLPGKAKKRNENREENVVAAQPKPKEPVEKESVKRKPTPATVTVERKEGTTSGLSRSERAKRRHDKIDRGDIEEQPVVDSKKARALAKVAKRLAIKEPTSKKPEKKDEEVKAPVQSKAASKTGTIPKKTKQKQEEPVPLEPRKTKRTRK